MNPLVAWMVGLGIVFLNLCLQGWPRIRNRHFGVDSWRHLDEADALRRHGRLFQGNAQRYLIDKPSDYPPLLRVALALIPKETLERWEWIVAPIFDAIHQIVLFGWVWGWTHRLDLAILAQLAYAFSPLVIMENSNLTTRSFASLLFTLGWLPLMIFRVTGEGAWLGVSVVLLGLLFLAHRLAIQALFFLCLAWSFWGRTWVFLGVFCAGMLTAAILSGGFYFKVLWGHLTMLNYWRINIRNRFSHMIRGLPSSTTLDPDMVFRIYQWIRKAPFIAVLGANPFALFLIPWLVAPPIQEPLFGIPADLLQKLLFWACTLWVMGLIIRQWGPVRFLGEGERYLEYGAFPTAILTALWIGKELENPQGIWWIGLFFLVAVGAGLLPALILQRQVVSNDPERSVTPALRQIFEILNAQEKEVRIFTIPLYLASATVHFTKPHVKVLTTDSSYAHLTDLTDLLPVLKIPLTEVVRRYRLTHLLVSERYVTLQELGLDGKKPAVRSGIFLLMEIP